MKTPATSWTALALAWTCFFWSAPGRAAAPGPQDLGPAFARAIEAIRRQQTPDGHWTTPVTIGPVYENPTGEINVFTPAVIIDLLDPVARDTGLTGELARARAYLRRQIEPTGLVRYHGRPGSIDPAQRGCELPPDADDTALAWRIAPLPNRKLLGMARREIERYRDADGLYRTWLAGTDEFRCFYERYAGNEWNPPDVAIEMHVYLFLVEHDRDAARRLCAALGQRIDDDGVWVWYTVAPLLPLLREADLSRTGCSLRVPDRRLARAVPGQQPYLGQAQLLRSLLLSERTKGGERLTPEPYLLALREGATSDFARLRQTPPLLYHNNLSATPPHYHWSEDFGYALWLRLYVEAARRFPGAIPLPRQPAGSR